RGRKKAPFGESRTAPPSRATLRSQPLRHRSERGRAGRRDFRLTSTVPPLPSLWLGHAPLRSPFAPRCSLPPSPSSLLLPRPLRLSVRVPPPSASRPSSAATAPLERLR